MTHTKLKGKSDRLSLNLSLETGKKLMEIKLRLEKELGCRLSITQVVDRMINENENNKNNNSSDTAEGIAIAIRARGQV